MRCIKIHTCASAPLSTSFALSPCTLDDLSPPGMKDQLLCLCPWPFSWHLLRGFTLIFLPFFRVINSSFLAESFWSACEHAVIPPTCWLPNLHLQLRLFSWIPDFYIPSPLSISTHIPIRQEWKAWAIGYVHGQADNGSSIFHSVESVILVYILSLNDQHHLLTLFHITYWFMPDRMIAASFVIVQNKFTCISVGVVISALALFCTDPGKLRNLRIWFYSSLKLYAAPLWSDLEMICDGIFVKFPLFPGCVTFKNGTLFKKSKQVKPL